MYASSSDTNSHRARAHGLALLLPGLLGGDALAAAGESTTRLAASPLSTANIVETLLGLVFVLAVMLLIAWLVKRFVQVPGIGKGQVKVLGGVSLGAREKAVLIAVDGRRLLVGVAPGRVQTLVELDPTDDNDDFARALENASAPASGDKS
jgi:flagellar protein FliO/FliZ